MGHLLLACALALLVGSLGGDDESRRVGDAGATVELPNGWHTTEPDGNVVDPVTRLVVASAPVAYERRACQVSSYRFPEDAVAVVLVEWLDPYVVLPTRPARFTPRELELHQPPAIECFAGAGGTAQFDDRGRTFGAYILLGTNAPAALADEARAVLDTLVVEES